MKLANQFAQRLIDHHADESAVVLEALAAPEAVHALRNTSPAGIAGVLRSMSAHHAARILQSLPRQDTATILDSMPPEAAANLLRRCEEDFRNEVLESLDGRTGRTLRTLLHYASDSAATRMDPHALSLPDDMSVEHAIAEVRKGTAHVLFNLYVVDRNHRLVGVLNLRELLEAPRKSTLREVMHEPTFRIAADADRRTIFEHPGWRAVHSLPVVDAKGRFLGALRYRTLQRIQAERNRSNSDRETVRSLGNLFWTGAAGVIDALTLAVGKDQTEGESHGD